MSKKEIDQVTGTQTTGHEWDGIKELDTPMPRWWLGILWATIVWAIGYWVVYPTWPGLTSYTHGLFNHSQRDEVTANVAALKAARSGHEQALAKASLPEIQANPDLLQFAMAGLVEPLLILYLFLFFVMSYLVYGGLMQMVGAAVSQMADAQSLLGPVMMLLVIPYILTIFVGGRPDAPFAVALSFIPPVNAFLMMARLEAVQTEVATFAMRRSDEHH